MHRGISRYIAGLRADLDRESLAWAYPPKEEVLEEVGLSPLGGVPGEIPGQGGGLCRHLSNPGAMLEGGETRGSGGELLVVGIEGGLRQVGAVGDYVEYVYLPKDESLVALASLLG